MSQAAEPPRPGEGVYDNPRNGVNNAVQTLRWVQRYAHLLSTSDIFRVGEALRLLDEMETGK